MAGGGGKKRKCDSCSDFLSEDIVIEILLRLPSGSSIGRSRCVSRSWRKLLSDPNFLGRILFFRNPDDEETLRILITGIRRAESPSSSYEFHYSSRSYKTLGPISESSSHDSSVPSSVLSRIQGNHSSIVGCCDGIFCIRIKGVSSNRLVREIVLWNPATSETKLLPHCPLHYHESRSLIDVCTGFGFDPRTDDYKVIRVLRSNCQCQSHLRVLRSNCQCQSGLPFAEVYSLRNDSWTMLNGSNYDQMFRHMLRRDYPIHIHVSQQRDTSRNEKCYWIGDSVEGRFSELISFDMATEEFAVVRVPRPRGRGNWFQRSCFMSKGVFMVTFGSGKNSELWGLLKYGVAQSWTKLLTVVRPPGEGFYECLEVWKDGIYICTVGDGRIQPYRFFSFDPATGEIIHHHLEIEGTIPPFHEIIEGMILPFYRA